jgi:hypothetical protein
MVCHLCKKGERLALLNCQASKKLLGLPIQLFYHQEINQDIQQQKEWVVVAVGDGGHRMEV